MAGSSWPRSFYGHKMKDLSPELQGPFLKMMDKIYAQESEAMLRFIEESRRALRSIGCDIQSEQEALRGTSAKLSESRLSGSSMSTRTESSFIRSGSAGSKSPCGSSLDSVTFETEKSTLSTKSSRPGSSSKDHLGVNQSRPSSRSPRINRAKVEPLPQGYELDRTPSPRPTPVDSMPQDEDYDSDKEYQEEKDKIMRQVTGAKQTLERERTRQAMITQQKKEKRKAKTAEAVNQMVREASAVEAKKEDDRKRQDEMVRQKLEQKKIRQREKTDLFELSKRGSATARPMSELHGRMNETSGLGSLTSRPKTASSSMAEVETPMDRAAMEAQLRGQSQKVSPRRESVPTAWDMSEDPMSREATEYVYEPDPNAKELVIDGDDGKVIPQEVKKKKKKKKKDKAREAASLDPL